MCLRERIKERVGAIVKLVKADGCDSLKADLVLVKIVLAENFGQNLPVLQQTIEIFVARSSSVFKLFYFA